MTTIEEFLLARLDEAEVLAQQVDEIAVRNALQIVVRNNRHIVEWHQNWPTLVSTEPNFAVDSSTDLNQLTYRVTQEIAWMTNEEYRKRFGKEPPTAPLLREMAAEYYWHPEYNLDWEI